LVTGSPAETKEVRFYNTTARSADVINIGFYQSQRPIVPRGMREYAHGGRKERRARRQRQSPLACQIANPRGIRGLLSWRGAIHGKPLLKTSGNEPTRKIPSRCMPKSALRGCKKSQHPRILHDKACNAMERARTLDTTQLAIFT
jgi:hypothetical protein